MNRMNCVVAFGPFALMTTILVAVATAIEERRSRLVLSTGGWPAGLRFVRRVA
jgi:hypothetical protein